MDTKEPSKQQKIWLTVQQIPAGKVATYGQIAELAGLAGCARLVGTTMSKLPEDSKIPWHRVINAQGKLSFSPDSKHYQEQKLRLEAEGIKFKGLGVALSTYRWQP